MDKQTKTIEKQNLRHYLWCPLLTFIIAAFIYLFFVNGVHPGVISTFVLSTGASDHLPNVVLPTFLSNMILFASLLVIGIWQVFQLLKNRVPGKYLGWVFSIIVAALLIWATQDGSISLIGFLKSTVLRAIPICLGAFAALISERAGIVNLAVEGLMLSSTFVSTVVGTVVRMAYPQDPNLGFLLGAFSGILISMFLMWIHGVLSIKYRVNQIISGMTINIFAAGVTSFLAARVLQSNPQLNNSGVIANWPVPFLSKIPVIGQIFFNSNIFTYLTYLLLFFLQLFLFQTVLGLRIRSTGEHPSAVDSLGINVNRLRYLAVLVSGAIAGLAGAYFTLGSVGRFDPLMTSGRGYISIAAMIFGQWTPLGSFAASLFFGFAEGLQGKLSLLNVNIPSQFLLMIPYVSTVLALVGFVGKGESPAALGSPYQKE